MQNPFRIRDSQNGQDGVEGTWILQVDFVPSRGYVATNNLPGRLLSRIKQCAASDLTGQPSLVFRVCDHSCEATSLIADVSRASPKFTVKHSQPASGLTWSEPFTTREEVPARLLGINNLGRIKSPLSVVLHERLFRDWPLYSARRVSIGLMLDARRAGR